MANQTKNVQKIEEITNYFLALAKCCFCAYMASHGIINIYNIEPNAAYDGNGKR